MKRLSLLLLIIALSGCATVSENRYGYVDDPRHGGYYYDREPVRSQVYLGAGWYNPYDVMFWGLRYSYFDPFWYPGFYYGVTYFPRYYYPFGPWGSWYAGWYHPWRYHHPYSPYWGSYWDHYYAGHWHRPRPPRDPGHRPVGRFGVVDDGVPRFGSARNAAERAASGITGPRGGHAMPAPPQRVMTRGGWQSARGEAGSVRSMPERRPMAPPARSSRPVMPSSSPGGGMRSTPAPSRGSRGVPSGSRSGRAGSDAPPTMSWSLPERRPLPTTAGFGRVEPGQPFAPGPDRGRATGFGDSAPARTFQQPMPRSAPAFPAAIAPRGEAPVRSQTPSRTDAAPDHRRR